MKDVLVIGGGGREHALAWKFLLSPQVDRVYVAPGNAGVDLIGYKAPHNPTTETEINLLLNWILNSGREFGLSWIGPEVPLSEGIVDSYAWFGFPVVGPTKAAARIETSKVWAKEFMQRHNIPTAPALVFDTFAELRRHLLAEDTSFPLVVKEDGLAAGKGVSILQNQTEAITWLAAQANVTIEQIVATDFQQAAAPDQPADVANGATDGADDSTSPPPAEELKADEAVPEAEELKADEPTPPPANEELRADEATRLPLREEFGQGVLPPLPPRGEGVGGEVAERSVERPAPSRPQLDEDTLVRAIASGLSEAQIDAILRGEELTASQLTGQPQPASLPEPVILADEEDEGLTELVLRHRRAQSDLLTREGRRILVEQFLQGREVTVMVFTDGEAIVPMPLVCDYKRLLDGDKGPMTGSMGAYSPPGFVAPDFRERVLETIITPAIRGLAAEGTPFKGVLYAGLILTNDGPKVLEFNARFGDPEAQVVLPLLETDLYEIGMAIIEGRLGELEVLWKDEASCCVVVASPGYPDKPEIGQLIRGMDQLAGEVLVFHAGTRGSKVMADLTRAAGGGELVKRRDAKQTTWRDFLGRIDLRAPGFGNREEKAQLQAVEAAAGEIELRTSGGRVLSVVAIAPTLAEARAKAYRNLNHISFPAMQFRSDIALREEYPSEAAMQQPPQPADEQPTVDEQPTIADLLADDPMANMSQPVSAEEVTDLPTERPAETLALAAADELATFEPSDDHHHAEPPNDDTLPTPDAGQPSE